MRPTRRAGAIDQASCTCFPCVPQVRPSRCYPGAPASREPRPDFDRRIGATVCGRQVDGLLEGCEFAQFRLARRARYSTHGWGIDLMCIKAFDRRLLDCFIWMTFSFLPSPRDLQRRLGRKFLRFVPAATKRPRSRIGRRLGTRISLRSASCSRDYGLRHLRE